MRHRYACPIRWADLDLLGHVNNVRYVDYLQEARVDMLRAHRWSGSTDHAAEALADAIVVIRHDVSYRAPLLFGDRPVIIECWVTELRSASFTLAYEVFHEDEAGERTVYLEASTVLAPYRFDIESPRRLTAEERAALEAYVELPDQPRPRPEPVAAGRHEAGHYPVQVRFSDVDVYRHVNNVVYFEYLQEARIRLFTNLLREMSGHAQHRVVVARTEVDYLAPILLRAEPYDAWSRVSRLGHTSMVVESEIVDGDRPLARGRVVVVFFDTDAGRPTQPDPAFRQRVEEVFGLA